MVDAEEMGCKNKEVGEMQTCYCLNFMCC